AFDHLMLLGVEGGRIVLEVLDQGARLGALVKHLCLAFINASPTAHWDVPCFVEIHRFGVLRMTRTDYPRRSCREGQEPELTDGNRTGTGPMGNLTDWPIQHNRSDSIGAELYRGAFGPIPPFCLRLNGSLSGRIRPLI